MNTISKLILTALIIAAPAQGMHHIAKALFYGLSYHTPHFQAWQKIRQERDAILQSAALEKLSDNDTSEKLGGIWNASLQQVKQQACKDPHVQKNHFSNTTKNSAKKIQTALVTILQSNNLYKNYLQDDIGILDLSSSGCPAWIKKEGEISPLGIIIHFDKALPWDELSQMPEDVAFIRKMFSKAKHLLYYDPLLFPTLESLIAGFGHELAHTTQSYAQGYLQGKDYAIGQLAEIDADIKNICTQKTDGSWILLENAQDIIKNFITFLTFTENQLYKALDMLTADLFGQEYYRVQHLLQPLLGLHCLKHPSVKHRQFIMEEFIVTMKDFGGSMSTQEFYATISIIATYQCMAYRLSLSDEFLKIVDLENAKKLERVTKHIKIPDVDAYQKESNK